MFDVVSYILGKKSGEKGENTVNIESSDYIFSDDGDGNITIEEANNGE